jgi:hypothetical protein
MVWSFVLDLLNFPTVSDSWHTQGGGVVSVASHILGRWPAVIKKGWPGGPEPCSLDWDRSLQMALVKPAWAEWDFS